MSTELTVIEHEEPRSLVPSEAGTFALAAMSDAEFGTRLAMLKKGRERIATIQRELMTRDVDYGTIPGTPKPTLYKPGAEQLNDLYHHVADFKPERVIGDGITAPTLAYVTRAELHLGDVEGPIVAIGYGSANSWERKHRYRTGERACPACGSVGTLLRSKRGKPEWFCWAKKGGCGETFPIDSPAVVAQQVGDVENPDPWDLDTTLLKMAEKRAHVDVTLRACSASGLFTQDVEDLPATTEAPEVTRQPQTLREAVRQAPIDADEAPLPEPPGGVPSTTRNVTPPTDPEPEPEADEVEGEIVEDAAAGPAPMSKIAFNRLALAAHVTKHDVSAGAERLGIAEGDITDADYGRLAVHLGLVI
jgi:hypothetical protein